MKILRYSLTRHAMFLRICATTAVDIIDYTVSANHEVYVPAGHVRKYVNAADMLTFLY